jgi:hypothetical protein
MADNDEQGLQLSEGAAALDALEKLLNFPIRQYAAPGSWGLGPLSEQKIMIQLPELSANELWEPLNRIKEAAAKYTGDDNGFSINGLFSTSAINIPLAKVEAILAMDTTTAQAAAMEIFRPLIDFFPNSGG